MSVLFHRRWLVPLLISVAAWLLLLVLFATQAVIVGGLELWVAVKLGIRLWIGWAALIPLVVLLSTRFPLERRRLFANAGIHMTACAVAIAANQLIGMLQPPVSFGMGSRPSGPPPWVVESLGEDVQLNGPPFGARPPFEVGPPGRGRPAKAIRGARIIFDFLIYWSVVCACQALRWSRLARDRERQTLAAEASGTQARLQALQMQINPHFLFNALNVITSLVHTNPKAADNMLGDLGGLLRASLDTSAEQEVTLRRELEFLGHYLEIERTRFEDRLLVDQDIAPESLDALVPTFILQPLVENAVRHGIEPQTSLGKISLAAKREGDLLRLTVADSGVGLTESHDTLSGIGLSNTQSRLEALYPDHHTLTIRNGDERGCVVTITIPFHLEPTIPTTA
ncbi:MAG: histidine kinase [Verrucomicrobiales bacterium]